MTQPDAATILSPSGKRDLVKAAIIEHTRAKVFVERNDFHQAVCCYERATTSLKKLLDDNDFSSSRAKLVRDQYEQMSREGDAVLSTLKKDHYLVLMLDRGCGSSAVKKAYRQMALKYHPDKSGTSPVLFQVIQEAYQTLNDAGERAKYDRDHPRPAKHVPPKSARTTAPQPPPPRQGAASDRHRGARGSAGGPNPSHAHEAGGGGAAHTRAKPQASSYGSSHGGQSWHHEQQRQQQQQQQQHQQWQQWQQQHGRWEHASGAHPRPPGGYRFYRQYEEEKERERLRRKRRAEAEQAREERQRRKQQQEQRQQQQQQQQQQQRSHRKDPSDSSQHHVSDSALLAADPALLPSKELKRILERRGVPTKDVLTKDELLRKWPTAFSVKELRQMLARRGWTAPGAIEKADLVAAWWAHLTEQRPQRPAPPARGAAEGAHAGSTHSHGEHERKQARAKAEAEREAERAKVRRAERAAAAAAEAGGPAPAPAAEAPQAEAPAPAAAAAASGAEGARGAQRTDRFDPRAPPADERPTSRRVAEMRARMEALRREEEAKQPAREARPGSGMFPRRHSTHPPAAEEPRTSGVGAGSSVGEDEGMEGEGAAGVDAVLHRMRPHRRTTSHGNLSPNPPSGSADPRRGGDQREPRARTRYEDLHAAWRSLHERARGSRPGSWNGSGLGTGGSGSGSGDGREHILPTSGNGAPSAPQRQGGGRGGGGGGGGGAFWGMPLHGDKEGARPPAPPPRVQRRQPAPAPAPSHMGHGSHRGRSSRLPHPGRIDPTAPHTTSVFWGKAASPAVGVDPMGPQRPAAATAAAEEEAWAQVSARLAALETQTRAQWATYTEAAGETETARADGASGGRHERGRSAARAGTRDEGCEGRRGAAGVGNAHGSAAEARVPEADAWAAYAAAAGRAAEEAEAAAAAEGRSGLGSEPSPTSPSESVTPPRAGRSPRVGEEEEEAEAALRRARRKRKKRKKRRKRERRRRREERLAAAEGGVAGDSGGSDERGRHSVSGSGSDRSRTPDRAFLSGRHDESLDAEWSNDRSFSGGLSGMAYSAEGWGRGEEEEGSGGDAGLGSRPPRGLAAIRARLAHLGQSLSSRYKRQHEMEGEEEGSGVGMDSPPAARRRGRRDVADDHSDLHGGSDESPLTEEESDGMGAGAAAAGEGGSEDDRLNWRPLGPQRRRAPSSPPASTVSEDEASPVEGRGGGARGGNVAATGEEVGEDSTVSTTDSESGAPPRGAHSAGRERPSRRRGTPLWTPGSAPRPRRKKGGGGGRDKGWWEEMRDPTTQELFYYHHGTGESQWEPPEWVMEVDPSSNCPYFINCLTGESTWDEPQEYVPLVREGEEFAGPP